MPKKTRSQSTPPRYCAACGGRVTSRGPRAASGRYYCSSKPDCQAAKQRAWRQENLVARDLGDAPTICTCCGTALKPRKVRHGDSPQGRWCRSAQCQRDRNLTEGASRVGETERVSLRFLAHIAEGAVTGCPGCGLADAVRGFVHPMIVDGKPARCETLGSQGVPMDLVKMRWPGFFS